MSNAPKARPSFTAACGWIAYNDSAADGADETLIRDYLTTALVADLFNATTEEVAAKVAKLRRVAEAPETRRAHRREIRAILRGEA